MRSADNIGARCSAALSAAAALLGLSACLDRGAENPFVLPYVVPEEDMALQGDQDELNPGRGDPFFARRPRCEGEGGFCELEHAGGVCVSGRCRLVACLEGWGDCDDDPVNGCEVDVRREESCGSCAQRCQAGRSCQRGARGYTCAVGVLCEQGRLDLDASSQNGCEWGVGLSASVRPQPEGRLALVQRLALRPEPSASQNFESTLWRGALSGFDAEGRRAALLDGFAQPLALTPQGEGDERAFKGVSRALQVSSSEGVLGALDVWRDEAYLYDERGASSLLTFAPQCRARQGLEPRAVDLRGGRWRDPGQGGARQVEIDEAQMIWQLEEACEEGAEESGTSCFSASRAVGPADYLRWFYPYGEEAILSAPDDHAPARHRFDEQELVACSPCALDLTTGEFSAPLGCYARSQCEIEGEGPLECEGTSCETPSTGCPGWTISQVVRSPSGERHHVVTQRGLVVLGDDGQRWRPLARLEERFDAAVVSGARYLAAAVARHGDSERVFLLHSGGFIRVVDVSLSEPVRITPAHPDVPIALRDLDERGPLAFEAFDERTLLYADVFGARLMHLNGLDHKRAISELEQDNSGDGYFGARATEGGIGLFTIDFGVANVLFYEAP